MTARDHEQRLFLENPHHDVEVTPPQVVVKRHQPRGQDDRHANQQADSQPEERHGGKLLIRTTFGIEGCRVREQLGIVRGVTVRSRSVLGNIGASLQTIIGGNITLYTELCEKARQEAFDIMVQHAEEIGANAVIGMRFDANEVTEGVTEVLAYGTAVVLEPAPAS